MRGCHLPPFFFLHRTLSEGGKENCEEMDTPQQPKRRVAFVLVDGIGDVSIPRFHYRTPLQVAKTPNLDAIASAGVNGLMDPVEAGLACGSDTAHLSLLGYDPRIYYRGRGAFESMGAGLAMSPGDIAFKVSDTVFMSHLAWFLYLMFSIHLNCFCEDVVSLCNAFFSLLVDDCILS